MPKKELKGIIVSDKMQKTAVVEVERIKEHPKYKRRYKVHKNYKAHYETGEYKTGDKVVIRESKPYSKGTNFEIVSKLDK